MDMPPQTESEENLMEIFSTQYIETLFYFCLKKTDSTAEAEDLASDITEKILENRPQSLQRLGAAETPTNRCGIRNRYRCAGNSR